MNVRAHWRIEPILPEVEPVLTGEQRAYLAHPQIIVGVAQYEMGNRGPARDHEVSAERQPRPDDYPFPVTIEQVKYAIQAVPLFLGTFLL